MSVKSIHNSIRLGTCPDTTRYHVIPLQLTCVVVEIVRRGCDLSQTLDGSFSPNLERLVEHSDPKILGPSMWVPSDSSLILLNLDIDGWNLGLHAELIRIYVYICMSYIYDYMYIWRYMAVGNHFIYLLPDHRILSCTCASSRFARCALWWLRTIRHPTVILFSDVLWHRLASHLPGVWHGPCTKKLFQGVSRMAEYGRILFLKQFFMEHFWLCLVGTLLQDFAR